MEILERNDAPKGLIKLRHLRRTDKNGESGLRPDSPLICIIISTLLNNIRLNAFQRANQNGFTDMRTIMTTAMREAVIPAAAICLFNAAASAGMSLPL